VNNSVYFRYLESARIAHFGAMGLLSLTPDNSIAPVLADTWCSYRRPALLNDKIEVGVRVEEIDAERGEFANRYAIVRVPKGEEDATVLAQAGATIVVCDFTKGGARAPLPPRLLRALRGEEQATEDTAGA